MVGQAVATSRGVITTGLAFPPWLVVRVGWAPGAEATVGWGRPGPSSQREEFLPASLLQLGSMPFQKFAVSSTRALTLAWSASETFWSIARARSDSGFCKSESKRERVRVRERGKAWDRVIEGDCGHGWWVCADGWWSPSPQGSARFHGNAPRDGCGRRVEPSDPSHTVPLIPSPMQLFYPGHVSCPPMTWFWAPK